MNAMPSRKFNLRGLVLCVAACAVSCVLAALASGQSSPLQNLTAEEEKLLRDSRAAVIATGFSEAFFDKHFEPVRVVNSRGDRRVVWRLRVNGHEATVNDSVGFYTDAGGRRADTHSVASTLGKTRDISRTISRRRAERVMRACIGDFEGGAVVLQRFGAGGRAALVFTAVSAAPRPSPESEGAGANVTMRGDGSQAGGNLRHDVLKRGGKKKPFLLTGTVNLETGRCVKGVAQVGSPQPAPASPRPRQRR